MQGSAFGRSHWCLPLRVAHHWPRVGETKPGNHRSHRARWPTQRPENSRKPHCRGAKHSDPPDQQPDSESELSCDVCKLHSDVFQNRVFKQALKTMWGMIRKHESFSKLWHSKSRACSRPRCRTRFSFFKDAIRCNMIQHCRFLQLQCFQFRFLPFLLLRLPRKRSRLRVHWGHCFRLCLQSYPVIRRPDAPGAFLRWVAQFAMNICSLTVKRQCKAPGSTSLFCKKNSTISLCADAIFLFPSSHILFCKSLQSFRFPQIAFLGLHTAPLVLVLRFVHQLSPLAKQLNSKNKNK